MLRHIAAFVRPRLLRSVRSGFTVLDAGCGEQPLRPEIEAAGAHYLGLDVQQNRSNTVELLAPLWDVPLADASVDVILATEVLEHVVDTAGAFREMARILRPGGTIVITTPFAYPLHEEPHDYVRLTPAAIAWHAEQNGLRVSEAHALGDELESLAVTSCNLFSGMTTRWPFAARAAFALVRLPMNVATNLTTLILRALLSPILPRKTFLSTACVLTR